MVTVLRPLSTSELLDRTFHFYRNHFVLFVTITAIPQLAVLALQLVFSPKFNPGQIGDYLLKFWDIQAVAFIAIAIAHAATVIAVSSLHLDHPVTVTSSFSGSSRSLLRVVWIFFVALCIPIFFAIPVMIVIGIVVGVLGVTGAGGSNVAVVRLASLSAVVIVPLVALRWWLNWSLVIPVTVLEGGGLRATMRRSKALTKGSRGRIFVIYVLILILGVVVAWVIQLPLLSIVGFRAVTNPYAMTGWAHIISSLGQFLSTSLVGGLATIALTLVYYDQRVRKEGFDLQLMMANLQGTPQTPQAAAATPTA